jgi:outer membrane protein assembly factor BamD (BamD/ComL family)
LLEHSTDKEVKVRAQFDLAQAYWKREEADRAKAAFQRVIAEYPDTPYAKDAEGNIHELEFLNIGQPVPLFARRSSTGEPISLSDFKGKVVLLYFWASW